MRVFAWQVPIISGVIKHGEGVIAGVWDQPMPDHCNQVIHGILSKETTQQRLRAVGWIRSQMVKWEDAFGHEHAHTPYTAARHLYLLALGFEIDQFWLHLHFHSSPTLWNLLPLTFFAIIMSSFVVTITDYVCNLKVECPLVANINVSVSILSSCKPDSISLWIS